MCNKIEKIMKPYLSIIIFVLLLASSVITGTDRYFCTKNRIKDSLNQALAQTIAEKGRAWLDADTIKAYRLLQNASSGHVSLIINDECFIRKLDMPQLRAKAYISFDILASNVVTDKSERDYARFCSDTIILKPVSLKGSNASVAMRGYAECSFLTVLGMSDQKLPLSLMLMSLIWAGMSYMYVYRKNGSFVPCLLLQDVKGRSISADINEMPTAKNNMISVGSMSLNIHSGIFYGIDNKEVNLTPMQFELMRMFFESEEHRLLKTEICQALWPGKDNACETLYALIKRLKPVVEANSNLKIVAERGRAYKLRIDDGN